MSISKVFRPWKTNEVWLLPPSVADFVPAGHPAHLIHYTPTHTSWLNQIEIWFSILSGKSLNGASFHTVDQLKAHIDAFIADYNGQARPFAWTKSKVHQKRLKPCFADR